MKASELCAVLTRLLEQNRDPEVLIEIDRGAENLCTSTIKHVEDDVSTVRLFGTEQHQEVPQ